MFQPYPSIAFFDSGIGGFSLLSAAVHYMPANYLYYADTKNMPYGSKDPGFIYEATKQGIKTLSYYKPDAIIIACFTASSVIDDALKKEFPSCVSMFDLFAYGSYDKSPLNRLGVIATEATILHKALCKQLKFFYPTSELLEKACPLLASALEEDPCSSYSFNLLKSYIDPLIEDCIDALFLGCTHYEYAAHFIQQLYPMLPLITMSLNLQKWLANTYNNPKKSADVSTLTFMSNGPYNNKTYDTFIRKLNFSKKTMRIYTL